MEIIVTSHAADRLHTRSGLNKKSMQRIAERAYNQGISEDETKGLLQKYISDMSIYDGKKIVKIYGDKAFIFAPNIKTVFDEYGVRSETEQMILVTVILLPQKLHKKAVKTMKRKKEK